MVPVEVWPSPQLIVAVNSPTAAFGLASVNVATVAVIGAPSVALIGIAVAVNAAFGGGGGAGGSGGVGLDWGGPLGVLIASCCEVSLGPCCGGSAGPGNSKSGGVELP